MSQPESKHFSVALVTKMIALNVMFWIAALVVTLVFAVVGIPYVLMVDLVLRKRRRTMRIFRRTISWYGAAILRCGWPLVRVRCVDRAPQEGAPCILVANHRSSSDAFLMAFLPYEMVQVINIWPARVPMLGSLAKWAGYLRVREMPFDAFVEAGSRLLGEGASIISFPEGTRSGSAKMGPFHGAVFRLAQKAGVNIVPVAIFGNEHIPSRGSFLLRPGRIVVTKLPAVTAEMHAGMTPFHLKTMVHDMIQRELERQSA